MAGVSAHEHPETAGTVAGEWLRDALGESTDLMLFIDADTRIRWCNRAAFTILGFVPADVLGRSFAEFVHPEDLGRVIGRSGRPAGALRTVMGALAGGQNVRIDIVDTDRVR